MHKKIKTALGKCKLSVSELSIESKVPLLVCQKLEQGLTNLPSADACRRLEAALQLPSGTLQ